MRVASLTEIKEMSLDEAKILNAAINRYINELNATREGGG